MKKFISILTICALLFGLCACGPRDILSIKSEVPFSKKEVSEFIKLLNAEKYTEEFCYNVTPEEIKKAGDTRIFMFTEPAALFVMADGKVHQFALPFAFESFVNAELWDYNGDGTEDLLYTLTRGFGNFNGIIAVFDMNTKKDVSVSVTLEDIIVLSGVPLKAEETPENVTYLAFETELSYDASKPRLEYQAKRMSGKVITVDGIPVYLPFEPPEFDFATEKEIYPEGTPGVCTDGFVNTAETTLEETSDVIRHALKEITIPYDNVDIAYDTQAKIWRVSVGLTGNAGGCCSVYLTDRGTTLLLVAGE